MLTILLITIAACNSQAGPTGRTSRTGKALNILTLDRIKSSRFLQRIIPAFEQANDCRVEITSCAGSSDLVRIVRDEKALRQYDLVIGLDNCSLADFENNPMFRESNAADKYPVGKAFLFDRTRRVIPYGYGYLVMLYDETQILLPPESFGELQDSRFLNQILVCDPNSSGLGKATLLWTVALFGNYGYQQFWKSVKKNIQGSRDSWQETIQALNRQECALTFGLNSTPGWIIESQSDPKPIRASYLKEGSFLYVEAAAVTAKARRKALAETFLTNLLAPETQRFVPYDLGLFPANESAPLPATFSSIPYAAGTVNDRLAREDPRSNLAAWLDFWNKLFSHSVF